jgi:hypothetical protein
MNKFINETVFNTMNQLANEGDKKHLVKWLVDCNEEIARRESQNENIFPLQYEKKYLEQLLV